MRTAIDISWRRLCMAPECENPRLSVIVADGSPRYLDTVCKVLEFHEVVDLVGRAANFEETIQLVVTLRQT